MRFAVFDVWYFYFWTDSKFYERDSLKGEGGEDFLVLLAASRDKFFSTRLRDPRRICARWLGTSPSTVLYSTLAGRSLLFMSRVAKKSRHLETGIVLDR